MGVASLKVLLAWGGFNILVGFFAYLFYGAALVGTDYGADLDGFLGVLSAIIGIIPAILATLVGAFPGWPTALSVIWVALNTLALVVGIAEAITG